MVSWFFCHMAVITKFLHSTVVISKISCPMVIVSKFSLPFHPKGGYQVAFQTRSITSSILGPGAEVLLSEPLSVTLSTEVVTMTK